MTEHAGCILAIVGSRDVNKPAAQMLIATVLNEHKPLVVVSGGAKTRVSDRMRGLASIDEEAAIAARTLGIQMVEFVPKTFTFRGEGGFAERNMKIVDLCVCLVRIASSTTQTYGSGWTADRAEENGKEVQRYVVEPDGTIKEGTMKDGVFLPQKRSIHG